MGSFSLLKIKKKYVKIKFIKLVYIGIRGGIMDINKKKELLINVIYYALIIVVLYLGFKYIFPVILPFIFGFLIAYFIVKISDKIKVNKKFARILIAILFYGTIGTACVLLTLKAVSSSYNFFLNIPNLYENQILPVVDIAVKWLTHTFEQLDPSIVETLQMIFDNMGSVFRNLIGSLSGKAVNILSNIISGVPSVFLGILLMIISSLFFIVDFDNICIFINKYLPKKIIEKGESLKFYLKNTLFVVLKSYMLIMLFTFTELSLLFFIFGIKNGLVMASIIAIFDIMPILGTGGIVIPWALFSFLMGDMFMGIKLLVIYGIVMVVRNYIEPKIVGAQLGLHPIITLISMFVGLSLFGIVGMFGFPITISYLWKRYKDKQI